MWQGILSRKWSKNKSLSLTSTAAKRGKLYFIGERKHRAVFPKQLAFKVLDHFSLKSKIIIFVSKL